MTFNLGDFPAPSTEPYDITVTHPDDFLLDQLDLYPGATVRALQEQVESYSRPGMSLDALLAQLRSICRAAVRERGSAPPVALWC